jgi:hypothetical protein
LLVFILWVLIIIIDIIISILSWGVKYFSLKEIVTLLSAFRRKSNSNNLTARSSQISNADENFKKEKTLVLILILKILLILKIIMLYYKLKKRILKDSKINLISSKEED